MSPTFPRTIASRITTVPSFPEGGEQWGAAGKGQFRAFENVGRTWEEVYSSINLRSANGRELYEAINRGFREKVLWDIQHPHFVTNFGVGGGSPLIAGAGQTGDMINVDGGPSSVTNWLRTGDIIKFTGLQLVYDVKANVNTNGAGQATIPISPPIFSGQSPTDNSAVEIVAANINFLAVIIGRQMPDIEANGIIPPGTTLSWREQPS